MAIIGKDGKDDGALRNFYRILDGVDPDEVLPQEVQMRQFAAVTLAGSSDITFEQQMRSHAYWEQVRQYGLVDGTFRFPDRDTIVVLSVCDEEEAEVLVQNDPLVSEGVYSPSWGGEMQWL